MINLPVDYSFDRSLLIIHSIVNEMSFPIGFIVSNIQSRCSCFLIECTTHKHLIHDSGGTVAYDAVSSAMCSSHEITTQISPAGAC